MPLLADFALTARDIITTDEDWNLFREHMREAHVFEIDADFAAAADQLKESNPSAFARVLPLCRLPYDACWFEVRHHDRLSFVRGVVRPTDGGQVDRVGVLMQRLAPGDQIMMHLVWRFTSGGVSMSDFAMVFNFDENPTFGGKPKPSEREALSKLYAGAELDASEDIDRRVFPVPSSYHSAQFEGPGSQGYVERRIGVALGDWSGEWMFWLAVVALLNSRNAVATEAVDVTRENARRRRIRSGRPDLLSYTRCIIAPRLRDRLREADAARAAPAAVRAHFVRGHFKARKTGLFWWSPFLRGDVKSGLVMKEYEVRGGARTPTS